MFMLRRPPSRLALFLSRAYRVGQLTRSRQETAIREGISVGDYEIIGSEKNSLVHGLHPFVANMVTLNDFRRNVVDSNNMRSKRRFKNQRKGKVQSLFCILLHSLHYACLSSEKVIGPTKYFSDAVRNEVKNNTRSSSTLSEILETEKSQNNLFDTQVDELISLYMFGDSEIPSFEAAKPQRLRDVQISYAALRLHAPELSFNDLQSLISSVIARTAANAYRSLNELENVPTFIKRDIIERIPKSDFELHIMLKLYEDLEGEDTSLVVLRSLIHFTKLYHLSRLEPLIRRIISQEKLSDHELNRLVFEIADNPQKIISKEFSFVIIRSQRVIIDHVKSHDGSVSAFGYFGMALSLSDVSVSRSRQFYELGCENVQSEMDSELQKRVLLKISETPDVLIDTLNQSLSDSPDERLWDDFLRFTYDLNVQHEPELLDNQLKSNKLSSKSALLNKLNLHDIITKSTDLDNRSLSILLRKLYKNIEPISIFPSGLHCARYVFQILSNPTRPIIGEILYGESKEDPEGAWSRYRTYLEKYCDGFPNEKCLLSLIVPSISVRGLKWDNVLASRIAVHEFRKFVNPRSSAQCSSLIPSKHLWRSYILLCGRLQYHDEISEIFEIWDNLRYVPDRCTLGMLLGAVPDYMGDRIREHGVEHLCPESYDEITTDVWDWPSKKEIAHWREQMSA
jgi:hypothetical protein